MFELFDPEANIDVSQRRLPHWFQPGVASFVTWRTVDSIPQDVLHRWLRQRDNWLRRNGIDFCSANWRTQLALLDDDRRREFHRTFSNEYHAVLDQGLGDCPLRRPDVSAIVEESLRYADGNLYRLGDFVIMPNHVHLLFATIGSTTIEKQCQSWKKFTAGRINRLLGKRGHFWQAEAFDHLVRKPEHFAYFRRYIAENPRRAGLSSGEFVHHRANDE